MTAASVLRELRRHADPAQAASALRFFRTGPGQYGAGDRFLGVRSPALRQLQRDFQTLPLDEVRTLLQSPWHEARLLALLIMVRQYARGGTKERNALHRAYLASTAQINSWDLVDASAEHIVGAHLQDRSRTVLTRLARSNLVWDRRIAIIATFHFIKRGEFGETLRIARLLLHDDHDLIHKAVGWMLREVGKRGGLPLEEEFLREHCRVMPRTMLRYAIERFPPRKRHVYMRGTV